MMLLVHISIALSSLAFVAYTCVAPSHRKLTVSYLLLSCTLGTGAYLIVRSGSHLLEACVMGLIYVGIMAAAIAFSHNRVAATSES